MFNKTAHWLLVIAVTTIVVVGAILSQPETVRAEWQTGQADNSCLTCHEDLYYLHDTGCLYCMTPVHKDRCTDCHEGNSVSMKTEEAHLGMIAHPQDQNGAKCMACHTEEETTALLHTFDSEVGFDVVINADTYSPPQKTTLGLTGIEERNSFLGNWKWIVGTSFLFGLWLLLVLISPVKP